MKLKKDNLEETLDRFCTLGRDKFFERENLSDRNRGKTYFIRWKDENCDLKAVYRVATATPVGKMLPHPPALIKEIQRLGSYTIIHTLHKEFQRIVKNDASEPITSVDEIHGSFEGERWFRNSKVAKEAKKRAGYRCQACNMSFEEKYGEIGEEYLEAHHILPLALTKSKITTTSVDDLLALCANCHRMIHRLISKHERAIGLRQLKDEIQD